MRLLSVPNQGVMCKTNGTSPVYSHKTVQFVGDKHAGQRIAASCFMDEALKRSAGAVGSSGGEIKIRDAPPCKKTNIWCCCLLSFFNLHFFLPPAANVNIGRVCIVLNSLPALYDPPLCQWGLKKIFMVSLAPLHSSVSGNHPFVMSQREHQSRLVLSSCKNTRKWNVNTAMYRCVVLTKSWKECVILYSIKLQAKLYKKN